MVTLIPRRARLGTCIHGSVSFRCLPLSLSLSSCCLLSFFSFSSLSSLSSLSPCSSLYLFSIFIAIYCSSLFLSLVSLSSHLLRPADYSSSLFLLPALFLFSSSLLFFSLLLLLLISYNYLLYSLLASCSVVCFFFFCPLCVPEVALLSDKILPNHKHRPLTAPLSVV